MTPDIIGIRTQWTFCSALAVLWLNKASKCCVTDMVSVDIDSLLLETVDDGLWSNTSIPIPYLVATDCGRRVGTCIATFIRLSSCSPCSGYSLTVPYYPTVVAGTFSNSKKNRKEFDTVSTYSASMGTNDWQACRDHGTSTVGFTITIVLWYLTNKQSIQFQYLPTSNL